MILPKPITINEIQYHISFPKGSRADTILAFGELWLVNEVGDTIFKVKGFTIKLRTFANNPTPVTVVDFPGFRSGKGFMKSFIAESKALFYEICEGFLNQFKEETENDPGYIYVKGDKNTDDSDIPF